MSFYIIATAIAVLAMAPIALRLWRSRALTSTDGGRTDVEMTVYRDQLAEVDRDVARGVLSNEDANRARLEISRRLLALDGLQSNGPVKNTPLPVWLGAALIIVVLGSGAALYNRLGVPNYPDLPLDRRMELAEQARLSRPSQAKAEETAIPARPLQEPTEEHLALLEKLREALASRPDDLQGHLLLARNAAVVGNYRDSYTAQERVIAIKGDEATANDYSDLADMMVLAVGGYVSPEAEQAITKALALDPSNGTAAYYAGLMFAQTGRPDRTFQLWTRLLNESDASDPWVTPIRAQIEDVAAAAGVRYTLPPAPGGTMGLKGPSAEDIEAASDMNAADRNAFIRTMVDGLSARLANEGGSPQEWAQLISALGVLGDTDRATAIWGEAQVIFGSDPAALATVRAAAESAGVTQ